MKKILFAVVAILFGSLTVSAQKDVKVRFGLEAGFNMTKWNGELVPNYTFPTESLLSGFDDSGIKPGFHAGALADLIIQERWSIQPEVLFSLEGSKIKFPGTDKMAKVSAMYIKIPVLVYYNIKNVGPGQLSPGLGLFLAGGVGGKYEIETSPVTAAENGDMFAVLDWAVNGGTETYKTFDDEEGILDQFDWGLNVKVFYEMQKVVSGLFFSAGFSQGLSTSKSTGISVSVGYKFPYVKFLKKAYNTGLLEYNP